MWSKILFLHVLFIYAAVISSSVEVSWNLINPPGIFGEKIVLACDIVDKEMNCSNKIFQWLGGKSYRSLCTDDRCGNETKYAVIFEKGKCVYPLVIKNLSEADINCDYTCSFGVINERKKLALQEDLFVYYNDQQKKVNVTVRENKVTAIIEISRIFPKPNCVATLQDSDISSSLVVTSLKEELFYKTNISLSHNLSPGIRNLTIFCKLGETKVKILETKVKILETEVKILETEVKIPECQKDESDLQGLSPLAVAVGVLVGCLVIMIILLICCWYRRRKNRKTGDRKTILSTAMSSIQRTGERENDKFLPDENSEGLSIKCETELRTSAKMENKNGDIEITPKYQEIKMNGTSSYLRASDTKL